MCRERVVCVERRWCEGSVKGREGGMWWREGGVKGREGGVGAV